MAYFNEKVTINNATVDLVGTGAILVPAGTTAQRPTPVAGQIRYNSDTAQFEGYQNGAWSTVGGSSELSVTQGTHGFVAGDVLYHNGTIYVKAQADGTLAESQVVGVVKSAPTAGTFILQGSGYISGLSGLTAGTKYYLSGTAGAVTANKPDTVGHYSVEIYTAISTTEAIIAISEADNSQVLDSNFRINDNSAITKQLGFDISGNTAGVLTTVATAQTTAKTYTLQDVASSNFVMSEGTQTINGAKTFGTVPTLPTQTANTVFAGPVSGSSAAPAFRALVSGDIPSSGNLCNVFGDCEATLSSEDIASYITGSRTAGKWAYKTGAGAIAEETTAANVLYGTKSYKALVTASDEFIATPMFSVPVGYAGKPINISFLLNTGAAAATTDYTVKVVRYTSAGAYAETLPVVGPNFLGIAQFAGFFIASTDYTDLYSIVIVYNTTPDVTLTVDQFYAGMNSVAQVAADTDWVSYIPTLSGFGTTTTYFSYRRDGKDIIIMGTILLTAAASGTLTFSLPAGLNADYTTFPYGVLGDQYQYVGTVAAFQATHYNGVVQRDGSSTTRFSFAGENGIADWNATVPVTWVANGAIRLEMRVPIAEWSSGVTALSSNNVKSIVRYTTATASTMTNNSNTLVDFGTKVYDTKSEVTTGASWKFTAKTAGYYKISGNITLASSAGWAETEMLALSVFLDTSTQVAAGGYNGGLSGATNRSVSVNALVYLNVGQYVHLSCFQNSGGDIALLNNSTYNWIEIEQITDKDALAILPISTENIVCRTTGVAPAAGFLGELKSAYVAAASAVSLTSNQYTDVTSLVLTDGIWLISGINQYLINGATVSSVNNVAGFGSISGNNGTGLITGLNNASQINGFSATSAAISVSVPTITVRLSGSTLTLPDNSTMTLTNKTIYLKAYGGTFTGGPVTVYGSIQAVRIA